MDKLRVRFDGWCCRIDELVTNTGLYITWNECFSSQATAEEFINKFTERSLRN